MCLKLGLTVQRNHHNSLERAIAIEQAHMSMLAYQAVLGDVVQVWASGTVHLYVSLWGFPNEVVNKIVCRPDKPACFNSAHP